MHNVPSIGDKIGYFPIDVESPLFGKIISIDYDNLRNIAGYWMVIDGSWKNIWIPIKNLINVTLRKDDYSFPSADDMRKKSMEYSSSPISEKSKMKLKEIGNLIDAAASLGNTSIAYKFDDPIDYHVANTLHECGYKLNRFPNTEKFSISW